MHCVPQNAHRFWPQTVHGEEFGFTHRDEYDPATSGRRQ